LLICKKLLVNKVPAGQIETDRDDETAGSQSRQTARSIL